MENRPVSVRTGDAPTDWWRNWYARDYSWHGLAHMPGHSGQNLQEIWRDEASRLIAEPGSSRQWTRYHCPLVFGDGTRSPKATWTPAQWAELHGTLRTRLALSEAGRPCLLSGMVLDGLDEGEPELDWDPEARLWLRADHACFLGTVNARNLHFGLADFSGAWFGGGSDFSGAILPAAIGAMSATPAPSASPVPPPTAGRPETTLPDLIITKAQAIPEARPQADETQRGPKPRRLGLWLAVGAAVLGTAVLLVLKSL